MTLNVNIVTLISILGFIGGEENSVIKSENLTPYVQNHGSRLSHRKIRDCHTEKFGSAEPSELHPAHTSQEISLPFLSVRQFVKELKSTRRIIRGHYAIVSNPLKTLSVLEPNQDGGCKLNIRQTVAESSRQRNCILAVNAGYFNTTNGSCLGNVVSDGRIVHDSGGVQNAHFGLKKDGNIFLGYLSQEELNSGNLQQLVGGVVMILKQKNDFVNFSKSLECDETEETGSMDNFVDIVSSRTAIGHDEQGKVIIVQVDGESRLDGVSLWEMQELLREFGAVNAINLDGGGSATFVVNGTVVNYPYDTCEDQRFTCSRKVSTIMCVHSPYCDPYDCSGHGMCIMGQCRCNPNWLSPKCNELSCGANNCSSHGICTEHGCFCEPGWEGNDCENNCKQGWYGLNCQHPCRCLNNATCNHVNGFCSCKSGFVGPFCEHTCPFGYFGLNCANLCKCEDSCSCDTISGKCDNQTSNYFDIAPHCMVHNVMEQHQAQKDSKDERKHLLAIIVQSAVTTISVTVCVLLVFFTYICYCRRSVRCCQSKKRYRGHEPFSMSEMEPSDSDSSETQRILMRNGK